jgi:hypothetical protein
MKHFRSSLLKTERLAPALCRELSSAKVGDPQEFWSKWSIQMADKKIEREKIKDLPKGKVDQKNPKELSRNELDKVVGGSANQVDAQGKRTATFFMPPMPR